MAMNATQLAEAIVDALKTVNPEITGAQETDLKSKWELIVTEFVDHIKNEAEVTVNVVVPGTPFTGTASGTIT